MKNFDFRSKINYPCECFIVLTYGNPNPTDGRPSSEIYGHDLCELHHKKLVSDYYKRKKLYEDAKEVSDIS